MYRWADYDDFNFDAVHHPAVNALLEYKWYTTLLSDLRMHTLYSEHGCTHFTFNRHRNTIGFKYWIVKFAWKSIYYILVLRSIFMQVYGTTQSKGIFIAIIVMASMFLYFEVFRLFLYFFSYFK